MSWDDVDFQVPTVPPEEAEEEYRPPRGAPSTSSAPPPTDDDLEDRPVLLLELTALAKQLDEEDVLLVRQMLVTALHGSFAAKSAELLRSGHCWHSVRWKVEADQEAREEQMPEGVFTVVEYPREINGVSVSALWDTVMRRTPYEALDAAKDRVAASALALPTKADLCVELEALADREAELAARRAAAAGRLRSLKSERERTVERVARQHEGRSNGSPMSAKAAASVQSMLDSLDGHLAEAADELEQAIADGGADAPEGARSAVDLLLGLVFEAAPRPLWAAPAEFAVEMAQRQGELRRMWASTFGRLPAASERALAYAPRSAAERCRAGGKGALLVPPPPSVQAVPSAQATRALELTARAAAAVWSGASARQEDG